MEPRLLLRWGWGVLPRSEKKVIGNQGHIAQLIYLCKVT
jgi:hypothetical protein